MKQCGKHISEQRGFCALEEGHKDLCDKFPRVARQGVNTPQKRTLIPTVPAHYIKTAQPENSTVICLGRTVGAKGCGAVLPVKELTYIQTHWYTEPYSCSGGDYWNQGEGQFICPKCEEKNRLYERPEVEKLKRYFKEIKDTYRENN